jgi:integrase
MNSKTQEVKLSDAVILRYAVSGVRQLRDVSSGVIFRYHSDRAKGSFFIRVYHDGREKWAKLGGYPQIKTGHVLANVSAKRAKLSLDLDCSVRLDRFETLGDLLVWYRDRVAKSVARSSSRKSGIKSAINCHLIPLIGALGVEDLTPNNVDQLFISEVQDSLSIGYIESIFGVLKGALNQAKKLGRIESNPISSVVFSDFIQERPKEKPARLSPVDVVEVVSVLPPSLSVSRLLPLLMLLFATRITETRRLRWDWIDWPLSLLTIPAHETKSGVEIDIPLTGVVVRILEAYRSHLLRLGALSVWVFPSPNRRGKPIGKTKASELFQAVSNGEWSSHDLRKVARQIWTLQGVDYYVGERLLNHSMSSLDRVYNRAELIDKKREALEAYHGFLISRGAILMTETETRRRQTFIIGQDQTPQGLALEPTESY